MQISTLIQRVLKISLIFRANFVFS